MSRSILWGAAAIAVALWPTAAQAASGSPQSLLGTGPAWSVEGAQTEVWLGYSVAAAGDINGDGYDDVIVGAPRFQNGTYGEGRVTLHPGSPAGLSAAPSWSAEGDLLGIEFGRAIAGAGDVNGDGYDDVLVGAPFYSGWKGRAFLYYGSPAGLSPGPGWIGECNCPGAQLGRAVGAAGDVNADGFDDVLVGAPNYVHLGVTRGAAFVYLGSAGGLSPTATILIGPVNSTGFSAFGQGLGPAGDVDGDGYSDVVVSAAEFDNGQTNEGAAFLYAGSSSGLLTSPVWMVESDQADARLGLSATTAGDVNGDGYSDLLLGAPFFDVADVNEGLLRVYHGSPSGLPAAASWSAVGATASAWLGFSAGSAGDIDGDGFDDIVTGTPSWVQNQRTLGAAFFAFGSPSGLPAGPLGSIRTGPNEGSEFGAAVSSGGDVDADGSADVLIGAPSFNNDASGLAHVGKAFLYAGLPSSLDRDGDGRSPMTGDCDDRDPLRWAPPREATNLTFLDGETLAWDVQILPDGLPVAFDLLRSGAAGDFLAGALCVERNDGGDALAFDAAAPAPGGIYHYLVRAENECRAGTDMGPLGSTSTGAPRMGLVCR